MELIFVMFILVAAKLFTVAINFIVYFDLAIFIAFIVIIMAFLKLIFLLFFRLIFIVVLIISLISRQTQLPTFKVEEVMVYFLSELPWQPYHLLLSNHIDSQDQNYFYETLL